MRRWGAVFAVGLGLTVVAPQASALSVIGPDSTQPANSFQQANFTTATYGDFAVVGNGVLRCPNDTEPTEGGGTSADCRAASAGRSGFKNDGFYLRRAGSDDGTLVDSSSAQLTVPAGASIEYAQLNWGGNTGRTRIDVELPLGPTPLPLASVTLPPTSCTGLHSSTLVPNLLAPAQLPPSPPAAPTPDRQNLALSVRTATSTAAGPAVPVEPTNYGTAGLDPEMYSAYADVTGTIAAAATSAAADPGMPTTLDVTVGNVWAVAGFGCSAGWSLVVVFGYPAPPTDPTNPYQRLREVDVYTNRLVQEPFMSTDLAIPASNVDANRAGVELGLTAFGGDPDHSGAVTVDGQPQADPCGAADFFSACAQGAIDPFAPNTFIRDNFSVDAKAIVPIRAAVADGPDVDIGLSGASRPYLLQNIVVSEDIDPSIGVTMTGPAQPVHAGDPATVAVAVRNTGDVPLHDVGLTVGPAATAPTCRPTVAGTLAPGDTVTATCTLTAADTTFTATATATGEYHLNDPHTTVTGTASATVPVIGPVIAVALTADPPVVRKTDPGQQITLTFAVTNNSPTAEGPLDATVTTTPALPECQPAPIDQIQPGFTATTTCTFQPTADIHLTATATATSRTFPHDKATADAPELGVGVINPALAIAVVPDPATVAPSGPVNFTVAVHNTGDVPLAMTVTDEAAPACAFTIGGTGLASGTAQSQKCTVTAMSAPGSLTDTASFTASPVGTTATGIPITGPAATAQLAGQASGTATISAAASRTGTSGGGGGGATGSGSPIGGAPTGGTAPGGGSSSSGGSAPPGLAYTGVAIGVPLALGIGLAALGAALLLRRRRTTNPHLGRGLTIRHPR